MPGRKTDVTDAEWLADLLQHGLLQASFIPPVEQRDRRDLTRQRTQLVRDRARGINRLQKVLATANIKLSSVATDITGPSCRNILAALVEDRLDPTQLDALLAGRLRNKLPHLQAALQMWPYSDWGDPRLELSRDWVLVHGRAESTPCKIGYLNRAG